MSEQDKAVNGELEQLRIQLAGCSIVALTNEPRLQKGDWAWSASYQDVADLRDAKEEAEQRAEAIEAERDALRKQMERVHRLMTYPSDSLAGAFPPTEDAPSFEKRMRYYEIVQGEVGEIARQALSAQPSPIAEAERDALRKALNRALPFIETHAAMVPTQSAHRNVEKCIKEMRQALSAQPSPIAEAERALVEAARNEHAAYHKLCMSEVAVSGCEEAKGQHHVAMVAYREACDNLAKLLKARLAQMGDGDG